MRSKTDALIHLVVYYWHAYLKKVSTDAEKEKEILSILDSLSHWWEIDSSKIAEEKIKLRLVQEP